MEALEIFRMSFGIVVLCCCCSPIMRLLGVKGSFVTSSCSIRVKALNIQRRRPAEKIMGVQPWY